MRFHLHLKLIATLASTAMAAIVYAQNTPAQQSWQAGIVLDGATTSRGLALGARDQGLGLGHSDVVIRGELSKSLTGEAIASFHTKDKKFETHLENAWVQTKSLPNGLQVKLGRFGSQIGYLNELHPHADDFTERPLLYRGFFGSHWYDDGVRLNWTAPTPFYLRLGAEVFSGKKLVPDATSDSSSRVATLNAKMGHDISQNSSWQWGLSHLHNRREAKVETHDPSADEHSHSHAASFSGKRMWVSDLVWKWAPDGNNRNQQLRLNWEYAQVSGINRYAETSMRHKASSLGAVWKFNPAWEAGVRTDWLQAYKSEDHSGDIELTKGRIKESAIMVAYKPTHTQTLRLQLTQQKASGANDEGESVFANPAKRSIQLQYVIGFGAHSAHSY